MKEYVDFALLKGKVTHFRRFFNHKKRFFSGAKNFKRFRGLRPISSGPEFFDVFFCIKLTIATCINPAEIVTLS